MQHINYALPEIVFLDGFSHEGDSLEGRTVIQHVRTYTIVEAIALDDMAAIDLPGSKHEFTYTNGSGITERHVLALHFSLAEEYLLPEIYDKITAWYCAYLRWEDKNINTDEKGRHN